jgi:hypothetical protein
MRACGDAPLYAPLYAAHAVIPHAMQAPRGWRRRRRR